MKPMDIQLLPMTRAYMHELFRGFVYDPDIFQDMSLYERAKKGGYDPKRVDAMFDRNEAQQDRRTFAVLLGHRVIGQVDLKHIDVQEKTCELSIHLQSDAVKNRGFGTRAERLAIAYAFDELGMDSIFADSIEKNRRSQHVLENLGFICLGEKNGFKLYRLDKRKGE